MALPSPHLAGLPARSHVAVTTARLVAIGVLLLALFRLPAAAQPSPRCDTLLATAHDHYTEQRFADAEDAVRACLARPDMGADDALPSYRLLALVHLRQDDLAEAKRAVIGLLGVSFGYVPDPVLDPPTYVALVETIRDQLRLDAPSPVRDEAAPPAEASLLPTSSDLSRVPDSGVLRSARSVHIGVSLGAGSYSGERGVASESLVGEFRENGSVSIALDGSYHLSSALAVVASYRTTRLPLLLTNDVRPEDVQIRPGGSSAWVHTVAVLARGFYRPEGRVAPYAQLGVSALLSYLNEEMRVGVGPQAALGVDAAVTPRLAGFAELGFTMVFPGDAVDRVNANGSAGDLLTFAGVGMRYRLAIR